MAHQLYISAFETYLPDERVILGREELIQKEDFRDEGECCFYRAARNSKPSDFAEKAVRALVNRNNIKLSEIDMVIYVNSFLKDYSVWSMSAEISRRLGIFDKKFIDIYQGCSGIIEALDMANLYMLNGYDNVIVCTSYIFSPKLGDHQTIDSGTISSDGAAAILLSKEKGSYRILSTEMKYDASLNNCLYMYYGGTIGLDNEKAFDKWNAAEIKKDFFQRDGVDLDRFDKSKLECINRALTKANFTKDSVEYLIMPNYCRSYNKRIIDFFEHLALENTSTKIGMQIGHIGAADIIVNLKSMDTLIKSGDIVLATNDGAGFTFGATVLQKV